ncbi:MAG: diguanylate cyclase, partial [Afipia sp.]|nr:diguanylate cyclase [Afipia sp.]
MRVFSQGAAAELRAKDSIGRLGGDEFAILLPIAAPDSAPELARTLHRRLSEILAGTGHAVT